MPSKKVKKPAKKPVAKKPAPKAKTVKKPVKKVVAKKPALKAVKNAKPVKKPVKVEKKIPAKKAAPKKAEKKIAPKAVKKPAPKAVKKVEVKKKKNDKKVDKKVVDKTPPRTAKQTAALSKSILAKTGKKAEVKKEPVVEKKNEAPQKIIIAKKPEGGRKTTFKVGDYAVYPSHGIGKIIEIEKTTVLGQDFSCYLMFFEKEKLTIKIPMNSAEKIGLRHLISKSQMDEVFTILRSGVKKLKGMWSRRAQEYETKINSGDIMLLAEVLRDLTRDIEDGERSYSERIIYETAINRLANEYSAIYGIPFEEAKDKVVMTAKDKLNSEGKITKKDEFDEFDLGEESEGDEDEESEDEDEEDEDEEDEDGDDDDYEDDEDDDERPRKRRK